LCVCVCVCVGLHSIVMSMSVCLSARITRKPCGQTSPIFGHVACRRRSILTRRHCDTLCTSSFTDDFKPWDQWAE